MQIACPYQKTICEKKRKQQQLLKWDVLVKWYTFRDILKIHVAIVELPSLLPSHIHTHTGIVITN